MTSLAFDNDVNRCTLSKERTCTNTNVSFIELWDIVVSINLIDIFHAAFFNHW